MKGLACPCPALPQFWQLGPGFMAEGSRTQAHGQAAPLNIQVLRAQYEGLRRLQRTQTHLMVLPRGGNTPTPAESMTSAVWINKERRNSVLLEEGDPEVERMLEEAAQGHHQASESAWHTHLEIYRLAQTSYQECDPEMKTKGHFLGSQHRLPPEGDLCLLENNQQRTKAPEEAPCQCQLGGTQTKAAGCNLKTSIQGLPSIKNSQRPGKPAHYPFPQRKTPRISQAARNLGLYGPA
ncbi:uncharacterized protein C9orf152 homolog [Ochotona curzoniae]|uniref:uncharacterized protein C9orf152 homolog n=1 Tax=Ochotona curzoniae TaxID=130825 RepID=UPI001B34AB7D|nr:uncharacterized protein C9orf152 homolog [Ochotona curzoniae]